MRKNGYDEYWRLPSYGNLTALEIKERLPPSGNPLPKSALKTTLMYHLCRADQGLLYYRDCCMVELQRFIEARQIPKRGPSATHMIAALEKADAQLTFPRFLDLPAELRGRIYDFYIAGFPKVLKPCAQPPLAKTSKLVREEVLPMFYQRKTFKLTLRMYNPDEAKFSVDLDTQLFLAQMSTNALAKIRHLKIGIHGCGMLGVCTLMVKLKSNAIGLELRFKRDDIYDRPQSPEMGEQVKADIDVYLQGLSEGGSPAAQGLRAKDIYAMRRIIEGIISANGGPL